MTTRDTIHQAVRSWFKTAVALTDEQIIVRDSDGGSKGVRPDLPYLTIKLILMDEAVGTDEDVEEIAGGSGAPTIRTFGTRRGTLSIQGFGDDSSGWLEVATLRLRREAVKAVLNAAGLTVITRGGVTDISSLVDTQIESRFLREFEISYAVVDTDPEELVEAIVVEVDMTFDKFEGDPEALVTTITVDIP